MPPEDVEHITEAGSDVDDKSDLDVLTPEDEPETPPEEHVITTESDESDEPEEPEKPDEPEEPEKPEEPEEPELEDLDEEELELDKMVRAQTPEYKAIVKKYPNFFKEFPGMRHTLFRMKAMDRIFSSVDEAKETVEKHDDLLQLEDAVLKAEPDRVLRGLKNAKPEAVDQWAEKFLPALLKENREAHDRITKNIMITALRVAERQARALNNKNLFNSVGHMSQFLFGQESVPDPLITKTSPEVEKDREALERERTEFFESQAKDFREDVVSTGERLLRKEISRGLDPDNVLPAFVKKSIVDHVFEEVGDALDKDEKHIKGMNELWQRANRARYNRDARGKLVAAYLSRAKQLVGPIRRRLVKEAAGEQQPETTDRRERRPYVRSKGKTQESPNWRPKSAKDVDWNRTSDLDILEGRAKPRGR